jgi:hypothetical protein
MSLAGETTEREFFLLPFLALLVAVLLMLLLILPLGVWHLAILAALALVVGFPGRDDLGQPDVCAHAADHAAGQEAHE